MSTKSSVQVCIDLRGRLSSHETSWCLERLKYLSSVETESVGFQKEKK
jgi:hypothetical protein